MLMAYTLLYVHVLCQPTAATENHLTRLSSNTLFTQLNMLAIFYEKRKSFVIKPPWRFVGICSPVAAFLQVVTNSRVSQSFSDGRHE